MRGPADRYDVTLAVLSTDGRDTYSRLCVASGTPYGDGHSQLVVAGDRCTLQLSLGESGITLHSVRLLNATRATISAEVAAGPAAPDWLPAESLCLLFDGDRAAAEAVRDIYTPLPGMAADRSWPAEDTTPLDRLAVAIGRSVARANAQLACQKAPAGVALVSEVKVRLAVGRADLSGGRVHVTMARPGTEEPEQFVELTLSTVPGAAGTNSEVDDDEPEE